jgi:hypothetical protein
VVSRFNSLDWEAYAGAERFSDGSEPLFATSGDTVVIGSKEVIDVEEQDGSRTWIFQDIKEPLVVPLVYGLHAMLEAGLVPDYAGMGFVLA